MLQTGNHHAICSAAICSAAITVIAQEMQQYK